MRVYTEVRKLGVPQGLTTRGMDIGPANQPRKTRTEERWQSKRTLVSQGSTTACTSCGRTSKALRQGRLQHWRRPCEPLKSHQARLDGERKVKWIGHWGCARCPFKGACLGSHGCLFRHPTGGRRYSSKKAPSGAHGGVSHRSCGPLPQADGRLCGCRRGCRHRCDTPVDREKGHASRLFLHRDSPD